MESNPELLGLAGGATMATAAFCRSCWDLLGGKAHLSPSHKTPAPVMGLLHSLPANLLAETGAALCRALEPATEFRVPSRMLPPVPPPSQGHSFPPPNW